MHAGWFHPTVVGLLVAVTICGCANDRSVSGTTGSGAGIVPLATPVGPAATPDGGLIPVNGDAPTSQCSLPGVSCLSCQYVNPFNNARHCKDYDIAPTDAAARVAAEEDCASNPIGRTIDLGNPGTFSEEACDTTGSVGYCITQDSGYDYVFEADCSDAAPSAKWGCEDQAGGQWVCTGGAAGDDNQDEKWTCNYVNPFNQAEQCKEYALPAGDPSALDTVRQDCDANPIGATIDLGEPGNLAVGSCPRDDAVGYCLVPDGGLDFVYEADCSPEAPSAKWGCEDQAGGQWVCLDASATASGESYTCTYVNPFNDETQCKEYPIATNDTAAVDTARGDCDSNPIGAAIGQGDPGAFAAGSCDRAGAIGYCVGDDGSQDYVFVGDCSPEAPSAKWGCEDQAAGTWICLDGSVDEGDGGGPDVVPDPIEYSCTRSESTGSGWNATSYDICREYGFIDRQVASSDCSQTGGVLTNGGCPRSSVAGYCPAGAANDIYYAPAECGTDPAFFGFVQGDPVNEACPGAWSCEAPPATSADAGEGSDCAPDDAQVLSCRYASQFEANNCADFPVAQGWDASTVESHCAAQQGADASTVAVVQDNSCLAERGPSAGSSRCQAIQDGKTWYAYGTPDFVCSSFISGSQGLSSGPFCDPY